MAKEQKSGIFTSVTDIFPTFEGKKEWKGYHKGGLTTVANRPVHLMLSRDKIIESFL